MQRSLRRSRSLKVTDFGTNRKLIYDFLLVISTNLPTILHRFQVMADYWSNFRQREGCASNALAGMILWQYRHKWYIAKTRFFGLHFRCRKYWCIFNHFYVIRPESYRIRRNYAALRAIRRSRSFKVTECGTNRKLICDFKLISYIAYLAFNPRRRCSLGRSP